MPKFRKKPVEIEAIRFEYSKEGIDELMAFCLGQVGRVSKERHINAVGQAEIATLEDGSGELVVRHIASEGDYIIKGIKGEFYPCKPDIFEQTYEQIDYN